MLERCSDQPGTSLEEFYDAVLRNHAYEYGREGAAAMLSLIARLASSTDPRRVWGLTSHEKLCLLAEDTFKSPWYVMVAASARSTYEIGYLMPESEAPWPSAYVHGTAPDLDTACDMIRIAMDRSGGWQQRL